MLDTVFTDHLCVFSSSQAKCLFKALSCLFLVFSCAGLGAEARALQVPNHPATVLACVKHFALYGAPEGGRDYNTVIMDRQTAMNEYLPPYKAAIDAGVGSLMASFNEFEGIPITANRYLLTDLLRDK